MNFSRDFTRSNDQAGNDHLVVARMLSDYLPAILEEVLGSNFITDEEDNAHGLVTYRFTTSGAECRIAVEPMDDCGAVVSLVAHLGRVWHRYIPALRWLGGNRSHNTVAVAYTEDAARNRDLVISTDRLTLIGDASGIYHALIDFCVEVEKARNGLKYWFPQFLDANALTEYENAGKECEIYAYAIASPKSALRALEMNEECIINGYLSLYSYLALWTGSWEKIVQVSNNPAYRATLATDENLTRWLATAKVVALMQLRRYQEAMDEGLPALHPDALAPGDRAALRSECLCHLGKAEEAIEILKDSEFDGESRVELIRTLAALMVGRRQEAAISYSTYEKLIGNDILALQMLDPWIAGDDDQE